MAAHETAETLVVETVPVAEAISSMQMRLAGSSMMRAQREEQDDRDRYPEKPQQNRTAHGETFDQLEVGVVTGNIGRAPACCQRLPTHDRVGASLQRGVSGRRSAPATM
jgi:hypothetical protein